MILKNYLFLQFFFFYSNKWTLFFRKVFCVNRSKIIFPINLFYNLLFENLNDCCINAILTKIDDSKKYILFDKNGWIEGISDYLRMNLFIDLNDAQIINKLNINFFIPSLNKIYSQKEENVKLKKKDTKYLIFSNEKIAFLFPTDLKAFTEDLSYNYFTYSNIANQNRKRRSSMKAPKIIFLNCNQNNEVTKYNNCEGNNYFLENFDLNNDECFNFLENFWNSYKERHQIKEYVTKADLEIIQYNTLGNGNTSQFYMINFNEFEYQSEFIRKKHKTL